jgi:hypothetical protein
MWLELSSGRDDTCLPVRTLAHQHWREWLVLAGIVADGCILRWVDLGVVPHIINGDEGLIGTWYPKL